MYIPWLAKFLRRFPPPKALRESRYTILQFAQNMIKTQMEPYQNQGERTIIANISRAIDPVTGKKLTELDLLAHANTFMYYSCLYV